MVVFSFSRFIAVLFTEWKRFSDDDTSENSRVLHGVRGWGGGRNRGAVEAWSVLT